MFQHDFLMAKRDDQDHQTFQEETLSPNKKCLTK